MKWSRLDHAAKLYATTADASNSATFRLSAVLYDQIDPDALQCAADRTLGRYQGFNVRLSSGLFWNFLARNTSGVVVEAESDYPCFPISTGGPGAPLLRIIYHERRISVEFFHALTDGTGGLEFLKTLLREYLQQKGIAIASEGLVIPGDSLPGTGEGEDGFSLYRDQCRALAEGVSITSPKARHIAGTPFENPGHNVVEAITTMGAVAQAARLHQTTATGLLIAIALKAAALTEPRRESEPFVVSMPVNLRRVFPSPTLRNFFVIVNIGDDTDSYDDLERVIHSVRAEMDAKLSRSMLARYVADTMRFDQNLASRFTPNILKRPMVRFGFNRFGQSVTTMTLSNLGVVRLPSQMEPFVERLDFHLYPAKATPVNIAAISYGEFASISFSRSIVEADFIRHCADLLSHAIDESVAFTSNEWGI